MRNAIAVVLAALALSACSTAAPEGGGAAAPGASPSPVVTTSFPDLPAPTGDPELPGLATAAPAAGTVGRVPGPFDDRFRLAGLRFDGRAVSGGLDVTSDVSDLLELQVLAGFYDARGRLIGQGRFTHHLDEDTHQDSGPPSEHERFSITVPARLRGKAVAAAVGVPVLVNE
jgi:hypothetical protein